MHNIRETCDLLGITTYTLTNWYAWQRKRLKDGVVTKPYLPEPIRLNDKKGQPRMWNDEMVAQLKEYKSSIVTGRNGIYGMYTNPCHKDTKKHKKQMEEQNGNITGNN